ncbi:hypothetical protein HHI36_005401, partial [Cryptolaemus montrouzieri]
KYETSNEAYDKFQRLKEKKVTTTTSTTLLSLKNPTHEGHVHEFSDNEYAIGNNNEKRTPTILETTAVSKIELEFQLHMPPKFQLFKTQGKSKILLKKNILQKMPNLPK